MSGVGSALLLAGATVLHVVAMPFSALARMLAKKDRLPAPMALPVEAAPPQPAPETPQVEPLRVIRMRRIADIAIGAALIAAIAFLGYVLLYSDTAVTVTLENGGVTRQIETKAETVGEFLALHDIQAGEGVSLNYGTDDPIAPGMQLALTRAFPVAVASGGQVDILYMFGGTVGDALTRADVTYDTDDELTHMAFEDVAPGMHIQHIDVVVEYETREETMKYKEETIKDDTRYIGNDSIRVEGEDGLRRTVRRMVYKDGALSSREVMNQIILKESVAEVKIVGTKIRYMTNYTGDTRLWKAKPTDDEIKETMVVQEITAYTHTGRRTSTGKWPKIGYVAVNPNVIPYGTKMYIPGYGYCTAQDTGAFRHEQDGTKNQIDIFLETEKECLKWGRKRSVTIYILK